jgi:hypothetical protein
VPYFEDLEAPEGEDLRPPLRLHFEVRVLFHGKRPPQTKATDRLLLAYVLVVDKAVREYIAGPTALLEHLRGEDGTVALIEGLGRFETCLNTAKRALRLLTMLGARADAPTLDRTVRNLAHARAGEVTNVRDTIEHIDRDILAPSGLKDGEAHLLMVNKEGTHLEIADHQISFCALRATLGALHRAGIEMVDALRDTAPAAA